MTEQEFTEIEALAKAATPGPWTIRAGSASTVHDAEGDYEIAETFTGEQFTTNMGNNAAFIAAARNALPLLLAEVRALKEKLSRADFGWGLARGEAEILRAKVADERSARDAAERLLSEALVDCRAKRDPLDGLVVQARCSMEMVTSIMGGNKRIAERVAESITNEILRRIAKPREPVELWVPPGGYGDVEPTLCLSDEQRRTIQAEINARRAKLLQTPPQTSPPEERK